jgi:hypothetical protein
VGGADRAEAPVFDHRNVLIIEATTAQDSARMADLVRQHADFPLGAAEGGHPQVRRQVELPVL